MDSNNAMGRYKQIDVITASQDKLIVMLYDGAIVCLEKTLKAMDKKHGTEEAHNNIMKARDILHELLTSLNMNAGDIANRLSAIYTYMNKRLSEANVSKDKKPVIEVLNHLKELREAWASISNGSVNRGVLSSNKASAEQANTKPKEGTSKLDIVG